MSYADNVLTLYESAVDDEYERHVLHQSSTVALRVTVFLTMLLSVILAWALPGYYSVLSLILILPLFLGQMYSEHWMKSRVARPRAVWPLKSELVVLAVTLVAIVAGIAYHLWPLGDPGQSSVVGGVAGAAVGVAIAIIVVPRIARRNRRSDTERLDDENDE